MPRHAGLAGARHFSDLIAWQLADELRKDVIALTRRPLWADDRRLRSQTEAAMGSVCRNIAEGFGCESHTEFARFLEISRRSLNEVQDCLREAEQKGYVSTAEVSPLRALARRAYPAINNLRSYLRRNPSHPRTDKPRR